MVLSVMRIEQLAGSYDPLEVEQAPNCSMTCIEIMSACSEVAAHMLDKDTSNKQVCAWLKQTANLMPLVKSENNVICS